jgi:N-acetylglutamate synthase-like GNAT family acetyltransferase
MGLQRVRDVALIRHAYVRIQDQRQGVGAQLLSHLRSFAGAPILIGTWAGAAWAIDFYKKHGFQQVGDALKVRLLGEYWNVPKRQVEASVVLAERSFGSDQREIDELERSLAQIAGAPGNCGVVVNVARQIGARRS